MNRKQNSLMRFSRTERLAQLSEQEIVIERKKREIQAKLEAQKKKQTEEALKKLESSKETKSNKPGFSKKSSGSGLVHEKNDSKDKPGEQVKESLTNAFSNDGSFLDQFKKLSQTGLSSNYANKQTVVTAKKTEGDIKKSQVTNEEDSGKVASDNERDKKDCTPGSNVNQTCFVKESLNSKIHMKIPPPGAQFVSQHQSGIPSSAEFNLGSTQLNSSQSNYSQTAQTVQPYPDLNFKHVDNAHNNPLTSTHSSNQKPLPKSLENIPACPSTSPNELPKVRSESICMTLKSLPVKKLEAIPNPLEIDQEPSKLPTSQDENQFSFKEKKDGINSAHSSATSILENVASHNREPSSRISSAFYNNDDEDREENEALLDENLHHWAELVAQYGDQFEDSLRDRKENDENLRFLLDKNSKEYLSYQKLVLKYRRRLMSSGQQLPDKMQPDGGENGDRKGLLGSERLISGGQQDVKTHSKNCGKDDTLQNVMYEPAAKEQCLSYQNPSQAEEASEENSKNVVQTSEEIKTEERRKRKRKSRWGDADPTTSTLSTGNLHLHPSGKLPAPKSTLLSQLTRSDPGLIQYARQTFGSTDLSEEDWKKAEDHYKINLLYQDMVKKRAEVEKLERQGKFKYEYDSDEDTEGGTWEHKLRKQEMQATQLWAEELTRQAAGKHHIGDFLPPEELERFMEKYNAVKEGREPDLSDYKEYKLKQDNVGYRLLQKMGWNEGQGLGQDGTGITNPVNKATTRHENQGLGIDRPDGLAPGDDEYDAYRKRMMLAYRFRPNPLNNPRRPYY